MTCEFRNGPYGSHFLWGVGKHFWILRHFCVLCWCDVYFIMWETHWLTENARKWKEETEGLILLRSSLGRGCYSPQLPKTVDIRKYFRKRPICGRAKPPLQVTSVGKSLPVTNRPPQNNEIISQWFLRTKGPSPRWTHLRSWMRSPNIQLQKWSTCHGSCGQRLQRTNHTLSQISFW